VGWLETKEQKYLRRHSHACRETVENLRRPELSLEPISIRALQAWRTQWPQWYDSRFHFQWEPLRARFKKPNRFDLALWQDGELCGLAIGQCSDATAVEVHYIESLRPPGHPLKGSVLLITTVTAMNFAIQAELAEVRILYPSDTMIRLAAPLGFDYCARKGGGLPGYCGRTISIG
jgi:hypothetical protein